MKNRSFDSISKRNEDSYFQMLEMELIERIKREEKSRLRRKELSQILHIRQDSFLDEIEVLGFTTETARLIHLVPLLYVAWSDQTMSGTEQDYIIQFAARKGMISNDQSITQLRRWFKHRPPADFFDRCHTLLYYICQEMPFEEATKLKSELESACFEVAECAGGLLGFGARTSKEEAHSILQLEQRGLLKKAS